MGEPMKCLKCGYARSSVDRGTRGPCPRCGAEPQPSDLQAFAVHLPMFAGLMAVILMVSIGGSGRPMPWWGRILFVGGMVLFGWILKKLIALYYGSKR